MRAGPIQESWYVVRRNTVIEPPESRAPGAQPQVTRFRIEGDTLIRELGGGELRFVRIGVAPLAAVPLVGVWRQALPSTAEEVIEAQARAGRRVDRQAAERLAEMASGTRLEYTADGVVKYHLALRTMRGTYDTLNQTFVLTTGNSSRAGRFRLEDGLLVLTQPDGKTEDTYIRGEASKEELKRAGVRYGTEPAQFDPPPELTGSRR